MINKEKKFISAVVYIHNNGSVIYSFLENITKTLAEKFEKFEIICVDDSSKDDSSKEIRRFHLENKNHSALSIINMSYYQGVELSINAGVDLAIGDFVYEFDTVYVNYTFNLVLEVYDRMIQGFDIVGVSPNFMQRKSSAFFYMLFNRFSKMDYKLSTTTFNLISRRALNRVQTMTETIVYRKAIYYNCGLKTDIIKYDNENKYFQKHKEGQAKRKELAIDSFILYTDIAYRVAIWMTLVMALFTLLTAGYAVLIFLTQQPVAGWTTMILLLSIGFFGIFLIFTFVLKYLSTLINLIFRKQNYIIESVCKLND